MPRKVALAAVAVHLQRNLRVSAYIRAGGLVSRYFYNLRAERLRPGNMVEAPRYIFPTIKLVIFIDDMCYIVLTSFSEYGDY